MKRTYMTLGLILGCLIMATCHAFASIEKLKTTQVPLLALLIEAFEVEGYTFNLTDESGEMPAFHSARWNPTSETLEWRFWVPAEGSLYETLQQLPRRKAVTLLKGEMSNLAVFVGVEPMPGFDLPMGSLSTANVPGRSLLSEAEWTEARKQLAAVSFIHLASPHKDGPILLKRTPKGRITEEKIIMPAPAGK